MATNLSPALTWFNSGDSFFTSFMNVGPPWELPNTSPSAPGGAMMSTTAILKINQQGCLYVSAAAADEYGGVGLQQLSR